jgi:hypothetical protein
MIKYEETQKKGEKEIMDAYVGFLMDKRVRLANWRGQFAVSREQIRQNPKQLYTVINNNLVHENCTFQNCNMEVLFTPIFGCDAHLFEDQGNCTRGVYRNVSYPVIAEDYQADGVRDPNAALAVDTHWITCAKK